MMPPTHGLLPRLRRSLLPALVVLVLGFATKSWEGPARAWVADSLGGVFYVLFFCLFFHALTGARPAAVAAWVVAGTCALEVLQLWHPPFLEAVRDTFLGQALLGTTFKWKDFPYYLAGGLLGWLWTRRLAARSLPPP